MGCHLLVDLHLCKQLCSQVDQVSPEKRMSRTTVQVPRSFYQFSCAAFVSAACINACAVLYEDSPFKRQSALIQVVIKGLAAGVDLQMAYGAPLLVTNSLNQP